MQPIHMKKNNLTMEEQQLLSTVIIKNTGTVQRIVSDEIHKLFAVKC